MNQQEMIRSLRAEIAKLQRVLDLLLDQMPAPEPVRGPGRPKGSRNIGLAVEPEQRAAKKRGMSAEGRAKIAAAQKKRWAAQKASSASRRRTSAPFAKVAGKAGSRAASPGASKGGRQTKTTLLKSPAKKGSPSRKSRPAAKKPVKQVATPAPETQADV